MVGAHPASGGGAGPDDKTVLNFRRINERLLEYEEREREKAVRGEIGAGLYTTHEIAVLMGVSRSTAAEMIRRCIRAGIMVPGRKKMVPRVDGNNYPVPAYELVPEKPKKDGRR